MSEDCEKLSGKVWEIVQLRLVKKFIENMLKSRIAMQEERERVMHQFRWD